jgi:sec-independent protein translocase protein TatA
MSTTGFFGSDFLAFGWTPSFFELFVILIVALLLFGKRLPEVARSLGKGMVEFKKGLKGVEDDVEQSGQYPPRKNATYTDEKAPSSSTTTNSDPPKSTPAP